MIEEKAGTRVFHDGDIIFEEGDRGDEVFVIKSGAVKISKSALGHAVPLALLEEGDLFAEMALLDDGRRSARATAIGNLILAAFDKQLILDEIRTNPEFALNLLRTLSHRLEKIDELIVRYVGEDLLAIEQAETLSRYVHGGPLKSN